MVYYCANEEVFIERKVTTVIDIMSLVGGFANILILGTKMISSIYSPSLLTQSLIKKLYLTDQDNQDKGSNKNAANIKVKKDSSRDLEISSQ